MVVEVSYAKWTSDRLLGHVADLGEREEKQARDASEGDST